MALEEHFIIPSDDHAEDVIQVTNNNKTLENKTVWTRNAYGNVIIDCTKSIGIYEWTITINKAGLICGIGIVNASYTSKISNFFRKNDDHTLYAYDIDGYIFDNSSNKIKVAKASTNDIITITLNTNTNTKIITFNLNNKLLHECKDVQKMKYKLATCINGDDDYGSSSITLTKFQRIDVDKENEVEEVKEIQNGKVGELLAQIEAQKEEILGKDKEIEGLKVVINEQKKVYYVLLCDCYIF